MATSRSPLAFQMRKGLEPTPPQFRSRFAPDGLLVQSMPTGNTVQKAQLAEGRDQAPDRAKLFGWPEAPELEEED